MSGLGSLPDLDRVKLNVHFTPTADIHRQSNRAPLLAHISDIGEDALLQ
jgi:hypothetical protein